MATEIATVQDSSIALPMSTKASMMKSVNALIPINDFGLPEFMYRADLLPPTLRELDPYDQQEFLTNARVDLDYAQGYPVQDNTEPFWGQLQHEPCDAYRAFTHYLDLPRPKESGTMSQPVRQLHSLKTVTAMSTQDLLSCCHLYYWVPRAQAYDLFLIASHAKRKETRIMDVEERHYQLATEYLEIANEQLMTMMTDPEGSQLKPKHLIEIMKLMLQVQRISSGASPFGSSSGTSKSDPAALPPNSSMEVILRTVAQRAGLSGGSKGDSEQEILRQLANDPETMRQAQELIIRVDNKKNPRINTFDSEVIDIKDTGV